MYNDYQTRLQDFEKKLGVVNPEWFKQFFMMLEKCNVSEDVFTKYMDFAFSDESIASYKGSLGGSKKSIYLKTQSSTNTINEFYTYMTHIAKTKGIDYMREFLERSVGSIEKDYEQYKAQGHAKNTNFFNMFLRQLIKENPQDVRLESLGTHMKDISVESGSGNIEVSIAGVSLGHLHFEESKSNVPTIQFTEFRTLSGLEQLGLGSHMFREFCREIDVYKPGYSALAWSVMKGRDGEKAYSKWGGYPVVTTYDENEGWNIDTTPMSDEQYENAIGQQMFYFTPDVVKTQANVNKNRYSHFLTDTQSVMGDD